MAYIGKIPATGNFVKLDAITTSATNTYNLTSSSVAFTPESANHMLVSLNGVIQAPISSFTVSGSTITFIPASGTLSSSDSIDFIMVYGNVLDIGTPSDDTVSTAKLKANAVTTAKITDSNITTAKIANDAVDKDKVNLISTSSSAGLEVKGDGTTDGTLQLNCSQNSHGIKLQSPAHSANQSYTLKFPTGNVTADKVLKVASVSGSGTTGVGQLSFGDAGGGAMDLLHTATGSNVSQIDMDGYFTSDYDHYKYVYSVYAYTNNTDTLVRIMQGGSVITSTNYWYAGMAMYRASGSTTANNTGDNGANKWIISSSDNTNNAQYPCTGELTLFNPLSTTANTSFTTTNLGHNSSSTPNAIRIWTFGGQYVDAAASSGVSFQYDGGNINGTIRLYGIKNT